MVKILSQTGISLADIYDIEGSIVGVEQLEAGEVHTVHEMGATVFSERFGQALIRATSGALAQNTTWDVILTPDVSSFWRVQQVMVLSDQPTRITNCVVSIRDPGAGREMPVWIWDSNFADPSIGVRLQEDGGAVGATNAFLNGQTYLPAMGTNPDQPQSIPEIAFRGLTNGFGAGTATQIVVIVLAFAEVQGISSRGLPIPSW